MKTAEDLQSWTKYLAGENIRAKERKFRQIQIRPKNFDICFWVRLNYYCQKLIFGGETVYWVVSPRNFEILSIIS